MSQEYGYNLAILLASLSEKLSKSDLVKKLLIEQKDFEPYTLFRFLDPNTMQSLTVSEIFQFCIENEIKCSNKDASLLLKWWDKDGDGVLNFADFLNSIVPGSCNKNDVAEGRGRSSKSSYSVKYAFARVVQRELSLLTELENNRNGLKVRIKFNSEDAFHMITTHPHMVPVDMFKFITEYRVPVLMSDVLLLVNKFDNNQKGHLTYLDFCEILDSGLAKDSKSCRNSPIPSGFATPRSSMSTKSSPQRSPTFWKTNDFWGHTDVYVKSLITALNFQISLDKQLEGLQKELCLMHDFTLVEAFKLFDDNCNGFITTWDLEKSMKMLELSPTSEEVFLIFRRYDKDCDGKLNFSEFCQFVCTRERNYVNLLASRPERSFSDQTFGALIGVLQCHIRIESLAEGFRRDFLKKNDLYRAFGVIDKDQDGLISMDELKRFMHGCTFGSKDCDYIMRRYDRNGDGMISYAEFVQELTPQAPKRD